MYIICIFVFVLRKFISMRRFGPSTKTVQSILKCPTPTAQKHAASSASAFPKGETAMNVFDRKAKALHRDRSARRDDHQVFDYLKEEVGYRVYDRVLDIKRHFDTIVDLGAGKGYVGKNFNKVR